MKQTCLLLASAMLLLAASSASAAIVYDNTSNYEDFFHDTRLEAGDQIQLAGTERLITEFSFEYFSNFTATGDERARLRLYLNDGPAGPNPFATPGTLLYDSGTFNITSGFGAVTIQDIEVLVESGRLTWTVQFSGITNTETAGLLYYDPPTVGSSGDFFWEKQDGQWIALAGSEASNNFGARVRAVEALRITAIEYENGTATISAATQPGKRYALEYVATVPQSNWTRIASSEAVAGSSSLSLVDPSANQAARRFYRVVDTTP